MTNHLEPSDEILDAVAAVLTDTPATPSRLARMAHVTTSNAYDALAWLQRHNMATAEGNGAWAKYRRFDTRKDIR